MVAVKVWSAEQYKPEDWVVDFKRRVRETYGREVATPKGILRQAFQRLLKDLDDNSCMLAVIVEELVTGTDSFIHVVGPCEKLLTVGVAAVTVNRLGGYELPWEALYYRRFARTEAEREFFRKWVGLLADAHAAPAGAGAEVDGDSYSSWSYVEALAKSHLKRAVDKLRQRFQTEGPQQEYDWREIPLPPTEEPSLVRAVKEKYGVNF